MTNIGSPRANAILLGVAVAFTTLMRPADAVFLFVPLLLFGLTVTAWRSWPVLLAVTAGLAAGLGEWLAEAYRYFGGLEARLRATRGASRRHRPPPAERPPGYERVEELGIP